MQHEIGCIVDLKRTDAIGAVHVDLANSGALKGDNSDGRVNWTFNQVLASIFLSRLCLG